MACRFQPAAMDVLEVCDFKRLGKECDMEGLGAKCP